MGEYLLVNTHSYAGLRSSYQKKCDGKFGIQIHSTEVDTPLVGVYYSSQDGKIHKSPPEDVSQIQILSVCGDELQLPYEQCEFIINYYCGYVVEKGSVLFKIFSRSDYTLIIELITLRYEGKASIKNFEKLDRQAHRAYPNEKDIKIFTKS
jgi:hypothetical protein